VQYVHIIHKYSHPGNYTLTITIDDSSDSIHHAVTTELVEWMNVEQGLNTSLIALVGGVALAAGVTIAFATYLSDKKKRRGRDGAANQMPPEPLSPPK
jgi:hypothetical protein